MRELIRQIFNLVRRRPIVWLPYVAAELLAICIWWVRGGLDHVIVSWFSTSRSLSVLGGVQSIQKFDAVSQHRAALASLPVNLGAQFVCILLFFLAFVTTADFVCAKDEGSHSRFKTVPAHIASCWRSILLLALLFQICFEAVTAAVIFPASYFFMRAHHLDWARSPITVSLEIAPVILITSWLLIPMTTRLLQPRGNSISSSLRLRGSLLALLAAEVSTAIAVVLQKIEAKAVIESLAQVNVLATVNKALANSSDVLFFVGLAILAQQAAISNVGTETTQVRAEATE